MNEEEESCTVAEHARKDAFYGLCSEDAAAWALSRLVPESLAGMATPVSITQERAGSVPRVYIECLRDNAIEITRQRAMVTARPCERVLTMDTDHSPFLSAPQELVELLLGVAR